MKKLGWLSFAIGAVLYLTAISGAQGASLDSVFVSSVQAYPGESGIHVPVYARVGAVGGEDLDGVNFGLSYDPSALVCDTIIYDVADPHYQSFYDVIASPFIFTPRCYPEQGWATSGIIFSMLGDEDIPPGYYRMFDIVFDVKPEAGPGNYGLHIDDAAGTPPIGNYFTHNVTVEYFEKVDGHFAILPDSLTLMFDPPPPYSLNEGGSLTIEVTAVDSNTGHVVTLSATGLIENMNFPAVSDTFAVTGNFTFHPNQCQAGVYNILFFADCNFGSHVEIPVTVTVANINRTPSLDVGPDRATIAGDTLTFSVMAIDSDYRECGDDTLALSTSNLPGGATFVQNSDTTGIFSWVPSFTDTGNYTVIFFVEDLAGTADTASVEITVLPHTLDMVTIPEPPPTTIDEGSTLTFDIRAVDSSPGHIVDLSAVYLPANATFPPESGAGSAQSTFTFDPDYCQAGVDSAVFQAQCSGNLITTRTVYLTVNDLPRAPSIEAGGPYSAKPNHLLTFGIMATDLDLWCGDDTLSLSAFGLPGGATFSQNSDTTGIFSWTPVEADTGSYTVTFVVDDHTALTDSDEATIKVVVYDFEDVTDVALVGDGGPGYGVAWGDWDRDGDLDVYIVNYNQPNVLYRNNGDGTFTNVASTAGVADAGPGYGAAWGDFDNDGDLDLYVTNDGPNILYRNDGDGTFTNVTSIAGVGDAGWGRGAAWGDFDNDGYLDLYVVNSLSSQASILYHNNGDGTFTNVASIAGVEFMGNGRGVAWGDYDSDGDLDLYVVNHWPGGSVLYRNNGDGTFTDVANSAGVANNGLGTGVAWGDYDADGYLDLYVVNYGGYGNFLYHNNGDGTFSNVTETAGVGLVDNGYGTAWADYDLDGDLDLYVVNYRGGRKAYGANLLYANNGDGTFSDATERAGVGDLGYGYGTAWGDYDNDGDLDLYVVNHDQANILYQNQIDNVDFIEVAVVGAAYLAPGFSNRDGVGAKVAVYQAGTGTLLGLREIRAGSGYCSMNSLEAEFGLDHNYTYDLKVLFPTSGVMRVHSNLSTGQKVVVYEERAPLSFSLLLPADRDTAWSLTPTLTWQGAVDPDPGDTVIYTIYYSTDSTFATYDSLPNVGDTTCSLPGLTDDTVYYWKVKGKDNWGLEVWSIGTFSFNVYFPEPPNVFSLLYPSNGDTIYASWVTLNWEEATEPDPGDSVLYTLYYGTSPQFHLDSTIIVDSLSESQYFIAAGLPDDARIYWKVRAFDSFGLGTWSEQVDWSFHVYAPEPPFAFNLISPEDRDTVWTLTPMLLWQSAVDPDPGDSVTYGVYYSTDSTFVVQDSVSPLGDTTCTLPMLADDATYYWRVKAMDNFDLETWSIETFSFNTYLVEPPDSFDLLTPTNGDTVYAGIPIRLDWEDASDPDPGDTVLYTLYLSLNPDFSDSMVIDSLSKSEYTLSQAVTPTSTELVINHNLQALSDDKLSNQELEANDVVEVTEGDFDLLRSSLDSLITDTTYYWRVKAYDRWGTERWSNQLNWNFYLQFSPLFIRGDYDGNGQILTNDALMELQYIFRVSGYIPPSCEDAADYDDDGEILTNDPLMMLQYIFKVPGYLPPPPPGEICGVDPTGDELGCQWHDFCMGGSDGLAYKPSMSVPGAGQEIVAGEAIPVEGIVMVPIDLTITEPVSGFDVSLRYDTGSLRFRGVHGGDGYDFWAVDSAQVGVVRIGAVADIEMAELLKPGTHRIGEIAFEVEKKTEAELNWFKVEIYGADAQPLSVEWKNGLVKANLPDKFALEQNYPNPFNSTTLIRYAIPAISYQLSADGGPLTAVRLEVYNILGEKVATLVDGKQTPGYKQVRWNVQDMASGVYFYKLTAGGFTSIRKMVLLK